MVVRRRSQSAFTLFEILITIAIVGLIMGLAVGGMSRFMELDMKKASNKLATTIRYLYNKSATEGIYIRLNLDLGEQNYWVEATADPVLLEKEGSERAGGSLKASKKKEKEKKEREEKKKGETAKEGEGEKTADTGGEERLKPKEPVFGQVDSFLLKPTKLPDNVFFKDVYVEHLAFPADAGKVSIFFFPSGYVENAVINLRNEEDDIVYSIKTKPVSGGASIENFYRNLEAE